MDFIRSLDDDDVDSQAHRDDRAFIRTRLDRPPSVSHASAHTRNASLLNASSSSADIIASSGPPSLFDSDRASSLSRHSSSSASLLARGSLSSLSASYRPRDLFASHAVRIKDTRAAVVEATIVDEASNRYRVNLAHVPSLTDDYPAVKVEKDLPASIAIGGVRHVHPSLFTRIDSFLPDAELEAMESNVASLAHEHATRRMKSASLVRSVKLDTDAYAAQMERRGEETIRRQEDGLRRSVQRMEAEEYSSKTNPKAKFRPLSAPLAMPDATSSLMSSSSSSSQSKRPSTGVRSHPRATVRPSSGVSHTGMVVREEDGDYDDDDGYDDADDASQPAYQPRGAHSRYAADVDPYMRDEYGITQDERDRRDPRSAASLPDVQLLKAQAASEASSLDRSSLSGGFSMRPSTASRARSARWTDDDANHDHGLCTPSLVSSGYSAHGPLSSASHSHIPAAKRPISAATNFKHLYPAGPAALSLYGSGSAPASLPIPVAAIEGHFKHEAWSQNERSEHEIDAIADRMAAAASLVDEARFKVVQPLQLQDGRHGGYNVDAAHIVGGAAARIKYESSIIERAEQAALARKDAAIRREAQRDALRFKTDEWTSNSMGILTFGETESDHVLANMRLAQRALIKAGVPATKASNVQSHDVALGKSVIKRRAPPPPTARVAGAKAASASSTSSTARAPPSANRAPKGSGQPKPIAAAISATMARAQGLHEHASARDFVHKLYSPALASSLHAMGDESRATNSSASVYRDEQDSQSRQARSRPFSAQQDLVAAMHAAKYAAYGEATPMIMKLVDEAGADVSGNAGAGNAAGGGSASGMASGATTGRPATAGAASNGIAGLFGSLGSGSAAHDSSSSVRASTSTMLGPAASHPSLLPSSRARASAVSQLLHHIHGHVSQAESLSQVEAVKESLSLALANSRERGDAREEGKLRISRAILERALVAPCVVLTPDQRALLPAQISNIISDPFAVKKKKKRKMKGGRRTRSASRSRSRSPKKGSVKKGSAKDEALGLSFPPGPAAMQYASNPLFGDLAQINVGDLAASASDKADVRDVILRHAQMLVMVFDCFSTRSAAAGSRSSSTSVGAPLMSQFQFFQLCHVCHVLAATSSSGNVVQGNLAIAASAGGMLPAVSSTDVYSIFCDSDDLTVEGVDVDELIPRPSWIERLVRLAAAKCRPKNNLLGNMMREIIPAVPRMMPIAHTLEVFMQKFLIPNALSSSPSDIRLRMLDSKVAAVFALHNIALQTFFSIGANPSSGTVSYHSFKQLMRDCDIPPSATYVDTSLQETFNTNQSSSLDISQIDMYFPEFLECWGRMADGSNQAHNNAGSTVGRSELAVTLSELLDRAWNSFSVRVPASKSMAMSIAQSHQQAAAAGTATSTTKATRVKFT